MKTRNITRLISIAAPLTKQVYTLILFSLVSFAATGQDVKYDTIRYAKEYYQKRVGAFNDEKVTEYKIIFLGNSLTQFGDWGRLLDDSTVINRGIAGDNTYGVLARLTDIVIRKPQKLFIEIGINDISQNIPEPIVIENIRKIVKQVHTYSPDTRVFITSILPTNSNVKVEYPAAYHKDDQINFTNRELMRYAAEDNYRYIDLNNQVKDKNGELDIKYAMPDGIHLNQLGYARWVKMIKTELINTSKN